MNRNKAREIRTAVLALVFLALGTVPRSVNAQQTSALDLSLTLVAPTTTCSATVDPVSFAALDAGTTGGLGTGTATSFNLNFNCTGAVAVATATFNGGLNSVSTSRFLAETGGATVRYNLWDIVNNNQIAKDETITFALPAGSAAIPLEAQVAAAQTLPTTVGAYQDQVTVTFTF